MYAALRWRCDVMQILVATLRGAVHQQQRAAAYAALLPSLLVDDTEQVSGKTKRLGAGPARGRLRGYVVPGPRPREARVPGTRKSHMVEWHRIQLCLQQKYQSAYSVLVIGCYFWYIAFGVSNSGRFDWKKRKMYQKPNTCTEVNILLHFSNLRALILQYHNKRGPTFPEIQKHFNLRERSQSWHSILLSLSNSLYLYEFNRYLGLWSLWLQMTS